MMSKRQPADDTASALLELVRNLAAELHPDQTGTSLGTLDSSLDRDYGFDSLGRVELLARIERAFGVGLPDSAISTAETPRDLLRTVLRATGGPTLTKAIVGQLVIGEAEAAPLSANTLVEVLNWHVQAHPDRPHIRVYSDEGEGEVISYRQLREGATRVAAGLQTLGLEPRQSVCLMLPTGRDYFFGFYGILLAGGVPVPIYPPARPSQLEDHLRRQTTILSNCMATALITVPEAKPLARLLRTQLESLRHVMTVSELSNIATSYEAPAIVPEDTAFLQYTSGSTGNPKGVILTHTNLLANIRADGAAIEANDKDIFVSWLPLYHDMGLIGAWLGSLYHASLLVIMSPLAFLTRPQRWLWAIHRNRGTLSAAPNFAYELCLRRLDDADLEGLDLSCWRVAFNGAEAVSPETVEKFCNRFGPYGFRPEAMFPVYGLAESSVGLTFPPPGRRPLIDTIRRESLMLSGRAIPAAGSEAKAIRLVACGRPLPGHQIRVVDPGGRELPERQEGRLQFLGPSATSGYFRNPEATRRLFDGAWLNTGDLAYIAGGDLYITGRTKDIIIHAGRNIYPEELEQAVGELEGIRIGRVAVFGSTDPKSATERLVVMAETRETDAEKLGELRSKINAIGADLISTPPDEIVLVPPGTILKTSSGKIRRAASRELFEQGRTRKPRKAMWWQVIRLILTGFLPQMRRIRRFVGAGLYAGYAWGLLGLVFPLGWLTTVSLPRLSWRWGIMRAFAKLLVWASNTPLDVQGLKNIPNDQPCVFVANHASYLDGLFLVAALPRRFSFVAKSELLEQLIPGVFLRRIGAAFVERFDKQQGVADAKRVAQSAVAGHSLLFFAEGTITRMPGLLPFHMGAFIAAAEAQIPVVPIAMRGSRSILRAGSWFPHHGAIALKIGPPIESAKKAVKKRSDPWQEAVKLRDAARDYILLHSGEPDLGHEKTLAAAWPEPKGS